MNQEKRFRSIATLGHLPRIVYVALVVVFVISLFGRFAFSPHRWKVLLHIFLFVYLSDFGCSKRGCVFAASAGAYLVLFPCLVGRFVCVYVDIACTISRE